ncbi:MAG TPA: hypothetical protein VN175_00590 [Rhizomicrobium sp.]|nr:hypothetical protein [Rhizomicrobium sp.]
MTRIGRAIARPSPARKWVGVVALLAFFLQRLVVQTHIHQPLPAVAVKAANQQLPAPLKPQDPIDQCRLCQELVHAGHFVAPSALIAIASPVFVVAIFTALPEQSERSATSFAWRSRAPPRH